MNGLPLMNVEERESTQAHGIPAPDLSTENMDLQIDQTIQLNEDAKRSGWQKTTLDILIDYLPSSLNLTYDCITNAVMDVSGFSGWDEATRFVQTDRCSTYFNKTIDYCLREKQNPKKDKDFIDGVAGIGAETFFRKELKPNIEKAFDAKYFYKVRRPLVYVWEEHRMKFEKIANYIHPGHWSYIAGHGTKFLTAVDVQTKLFHLDGNCYRNLLIDACVESMARTGSFIHYPMDNLLGGRFTDLKEFQAA